MAKKVTRTFYLPRCHYSKTPLRDMFFRDIFLPLNKHQKMKNNLLSTVYFLILTHHPSKRDLFLKKFSENDEQQLLIKYFF